MRYKSTLPAPEPAEKVGRKQADKEACQDKGDAVIRRGQKSERPVRANADGAGGMQRGPWNNMSQVGERDRNDNKDIELNEHHAPACLAQFFAKRLSRWSENDFD